MGTFVCPTVTALDPHEYRAQLERITPFAKRIHLDFADGDFAPVRLINIIQSYWPRETEVDFHVMYRNPLRELETIVSLKPTRVILHAESEGDVLGMLKHLKELHFIVGVSLLQASQPTDYEALIKEADHVLIFSGDLGHFGGHADMNLLQKVEAVKAINPRAEIGWDGGINLDNAKLLVQGGVDVLNVGGAIQRAEDPAEAYRQLCDSIKSA